MPASGIKGAMLTVAADAVTGLVLSERTVDPGGETFGIGDLLGSEAGIVFGEIEGKQYIPARVERHDGVECVVLFFQYGGQVRHGLYLYNYINHPVLYIDHFFGSIPIQPFFED